ncbi:unnamed protein product [Rotaria sp. Silwood1]|nr:unnamed protein product [Rotaria sp. Silwood1]CAF1681537.1 unnamed protein product [Rotaria sp. Silwood1]
MADNLPRDLIAVQNENEHLRNQLNQAQIDLAATRIALAASRIETTYVKLLPTHDDAQPGPINGTKTNVLTDNEQLISEDLKFSTKIMLHSLEPEILRNKINRVLSVFKFPK